MEVLHHGWELKEATVKQIRNRILVSREVAYTTIMTVMEKLSEKGYLKEGVSYVYSPAREPNSVRSNLIGDLIKKVFKGSPKELVQTLVKSEKLSKADFSEIKQMIDRMQD